MLPAVNFVIKQFVPDVCFEAWIQDVESLQKIGLKELLRYVLEEELQMWKEPQLNLHSLSWPL